MNGVELGGETPDALRGRALAAAAGLVALTGLAAAVVGRVRPGATGPWVAGAVTVLGVELAILYANLDANRPPDGVPDGPGGIHPELGGPNAVSLLRGGLFAWVGGFVLVAPTGALAWAPAACYAAGTALDLVDGSLARATGRVTELGARLDMAFDSLGFVVAPVVGVLAGHLPSPYLAVSVAHYAFVAARRVRVRRGLPTFDLPDRPERRVLAAVQMAFIAAALAPLTPPVFGDVGAVLSGGPVLLGFARDWLYVSGRRRD